MMPFYTMFDPLYWIIIGPTMLIALWASIKVKSAFGKWSKVGVSSRMTGAEAAARVLSAEGLSDVKIEETTGFLSDHYDPRTKVLRLSPQVYRVPSVAAVGWPAMKPAMLCNMPLITRPSNSATRWCPRLPSAPGSPGP